MLNTIKAELRERRVSADTDYQKMYNVGFVWAITRFSAGKVSAEEAEATIKQHPQLALEAGVIDACYIIRKLQKSNEVRNE